ncbi:hypothetical protein X777_04394, partial [Ooceraea biroi]
PLLHKCNHFSRRLATAAAAAAVTGPARLNEGARAAEPSPHPSRPLQVIASERHLPLSHLNGQNLAEIRPRLRVLQAPLGSSLPSLQDTTALQNSYAGRH